MGTKIEIKVGSLAIVIPVTPESFEIGVGYDNQTVNINGLGEILLKGKRNLRTISWSSFFPRQYYDFCQVSEAELAEPNGYIALLILAAEAEMTVQVSISDMISIPMMLSSFNYGQDDGTGDVNYTISFTEVREVATPDAAKQTAKRPTKKVVSHMYKWKKGDTWKKVAKKEMGDTEKWKSLKKTNQKRADEAVKKYKKAHPNEKTIKDEVALVGEKVLIK